jgi:hypothetical protein
MKISKQTLDILKNFSAINSNLFVREGNTLSTISPNRAIYSAATVDETFEQDFGIFNLSEFLGVHSLFNSPELEFSGKYVTFREGRNKIRYAFAEESLLTVPKKTFQMPECTIQFNLDDTDLTQIQKTIGVISATDLVFVGEKGKILALVQDSSNEYSNQLEIDMGADTDETFRVFLKTENLKLTPGKYEVKVSNRSIVEFFNKDTNQYFWLAAEPKSTFA